MGGAAEKSMCCHNGSQSRLCPAALTKIVETVERRREFPDGRLGSQLKNTNRPLNCLRGSHSSGNWITRNTPAGRTLRAPLLNDIGSTARSCGITDGEKHTLGLLVEQPDGRVKRRGGAAPGRRVRWLGRRLGRRRGRPPVRKATSSGEAGQMVGRG